MAYVLSISLNVFKFVLRCLLFMLSSSDLLRNGLWKWVDKNDKVVDGAPDDDRAGNTEIIYKSKVLNSILAKLDITSKYRILQLKLHFYLPFPGKYIVSSLTEYCVPGMVSKHWNTVSGLSWSTDKSLLTDTSNKPSFSTVNVVVSPLSWNL